MAKLSQALVLCAVAAHGIKPDQLLEADPALIKALAADGAVDPHKEAVAAAKARGADVVRSMVELVADQRAARADELRAEIAKVEALASQPDANDEAKAELAKQLLGLRVELDGLGQPV